jgi:hypothetical protein
MALSLFTVDGDRLAPTPVACSLWSDNQMHGVAVSGALARGVEDAVRRAGREDLRPARWTVDLFRPATMDPCSVRTEVVREGSRIMLVDAWLHQDEQVVARASAVWLKPSASPAGDVWTPEDHLAPPPLEVAPETDQPHVPFFASDTAWSQDFAEHQDAGRKQTWQVGIPVVAGEPATPFQAAASVADATSMVCNWGTNGVEHINTDITLTMSRLPDGVEIGLAATDRREQDGIAVATATMFDRRGALGHSMVTAIANTKRTVDLEVHDFGPDGSRSSGA